MVALEAGQHTTEAAVSGWTKKVAAMESSMDQTREQMSALADTVDQFSKDPHGVYMLPLLKLA